VHCVSGISRSGACVIAYAMKTRRLSYDQALELPGPAGSRELATRPSEP
jgi:hypothetical protein